MKLDDDAKKIFLALAMGGIAGASIIQSHHDEAKKSQSEKDDPHGVEWLYDLVWNLLDEWEFGVFDREDDYTDDLVEFLRDELSDVRGDDRRRIRVTKRTGTSHGIPDVLIDDRLVLELKVASKKSERDRLVGQCCEYSREWFTWAVVINWPDGRIDKLTDLLEAKSLNYIAVIPFDRVEDDGDDDLD